MAMKALSDLMGPAAHDHHHDHDHEHGGGSHLHDHSHEAMNLALAIFGAILIINSFLAKYFFFADEPFVSTLSALIGALILAVPIWLTAVKDVWNGRIHMNELVALGLLAAFVAQKYQEAGIIAFFMLLAILVEEKTAIGARESIESLIRLTPSRANRIGKGGQEEEVPALELVVGDIVRVRPGQNFPSDGVIIAGLGSVNQASITGESLPVDKNTGDEVYAGTENLTGSMDVRVSRVGKDTTLGQVRKLIEEAESTRLPIMRLVDRYVVYYTPTILMIAAIVWFFSQDLFRVVLILVIACPCAVVLATPSAVVAAIASAARLGVLIKNVAHIETAAQIRAVVFDKTGTLTEGRLEVSRLNPGKDVELTDLLHVACSAEARSNHPAAMAMRRLAEEANVQWQEPKNFEEAAGRGVAADFAGGKYRVGRGSWLEECGLDIGEFAADFEDDQHVGMSVVYVARDAKVLGWIGLRDAVREVARDTIVQLEEMGVRHLCMVTGDNESVARTVARKVGIHEISAECLPEQKAMFVRELKARGEAVAVVGDGVNDAPALAAGDIGIAMGAIGSDVAVNSASIALMNNDLRRIPFLFNLSRRTRAVIHQNLVFGALIIIGGLMLFIFGDTTLNAVAASAKITDPTVLKVVLASALHVSSSLLILFNSARLVRFGEDLGGPGQPAGERSVAALTSTPAEATA